MANRSDYANIKCPYCETEMQLMTFRQNGHIYADYLECPECWKKECIPQEEITYSRQNLNQIN